MMEMGAIVAVIVSLGELLKKQGLQSGLIPLLNVFIGIAANLLLNGLSVESAVYGLGIGLAAGGLYDLGKTYSYFKKD